MFIIVVISKIIFYFLVLKLHLYVGYLYHYLVMISIHNLNFVTVVAMKLTQQTPLSLMRKISLGKKLELVLHQGQHLY